MLSFKHNAVIDYFISKFLVTIEQNGTKDVNEAA